jgi:hypothetical protein
MRSYPYDATWRLLNRGEPMNEHDPLTSSQNSTLKQILDRASEPHELAMLNERHVTHGNFEDNAIISQSIKRLFRAGPGWNNCSDVEREAMDMIALKLSRVLSGRSMSKQHWEDIVGYAKLVEEKCF